MVDQYADVLGLWPKISKNELWKGLVQDDEDAL